MCEPDLAHVELHIAFICRLLLIAILGMLVALGTIRDAIAKGDGGIPAEPWWKLANADKCQRGNGNGAQGLDPPQ